MTPFFSNSDLFLKLFFAHKWSSEVKKVVFDTHKPNKNFQRKSVRNFFLTKVFFLIFSYFGYDVQRLLTSKCISHCLLGELWNIWQKYRFSAIVILFFSIFSIWIRTSSSFNFKNWKKIFFLHFCSFLQLAGYLGIPVISWNADNSGLERTASQSRLQIQLAPSIEHQSAAMLSK